jgi:hypothetical protein
MRVAFLKLDDIAETKSKSHWARLLGKKSEAGGTDGHDIQSWGREWQGLEYRIVDFKVGKE